MSERGDTRQAKRVPITTQFGSGHYLVLTGTEPDAFTALDPASPTLRRMATVQLASLMCGFGYVALIKLHPDNARNCASTAAGASRSATHSKSGS